MGKILGLTIGIVVLYLVYRIVGAWILPRVAERRLERYKKQFFELHPHVDAERYEQQQHDKEARSIILDKRKSYRK
ncbi:MAG: hypothetical protein IJV22_00385 [Bacteroidales bacterium]|nr:hypothetical protein [Bacteroidales bacterium]